MRKKLLAALLSVCIIVSMMVVPASASAFNDVSSDHWAASAIERWAGYEVLNGNGDGTFAPDRQMTRAEFASMLVNMLGLTKKSSTKFPDVPDNAWYADCISIAAAAGIITGDNGNAAPTRYISFNEAAVMLCRALGLAKTNVSGADWAKESIEKLTEMGAIGGSDTHLQAGADCNRAVVAALADKIVEQYVDEDTTITGQVKGVVLVVKGAKADIKDAVLSAPLVIESAEATLTNTTAQDVKVDGANSSVATDAKSAVAEVILGGEAPKADIKGTATAVTVAENATSAVVDAPASVEVKNESTSAITVNGETQEPTKTDDTTTTPEVTQGTSTPAHTHQWAYAALSEGANVATKHIRYCTLCQTPATGTEVGHSFAYRIQAEMKHQQYCTVCGWAADPVSHTGITETVPVVTSCATCGYTANVTGGSGAAEGHVHNWVEDRTDSRYKAPTCTTDGVIVYKCMADDEEGVALVDTEPAADDDGGDTPPVVDPPCGATMTATISATGHSWPETATKTVDPTCINAGYKVYQCDNCSATKNEPIAATGHTYVYTTTATQHTGTCSVCKNVVTANHTWDATTGKCSVCNLTCEHTNTTTSWISGTDKHKTVCDTCKQQQGEEADCVKVDVANSAVAATCKEDGKEKDQKCSACGHVYTGAKIDKSTMEHTYTNNQYTQENKDGTDSHAQVCDVCGAVKNEWTACSGADGKCTTCKNPYTAKTQTPEPEGPSTQEGQG